MAVLDRAGLNRRHENNSRRYDVKDDRAGQLKEKKDLRDRD